MPETTTATAPATPAGPRSSSPSEPIRRSPSPDDSQPRRLHKTPAASRAVMTILASTVIPPRARRPAVRQPEARSSSAPSIKDARSPPTTAGKNRRRRRRLPEDARNEAGSGLLELDEKWLGAVSVHAEPIEALCDLLPTEILLPPLRMLPAEHADDGEKDVGRERETDEDGLFGHAGSESPDSFASSVATNASERRADDSSTPDTVSSLGLSSPSPPSFLPPPPLLSSSSPFTAPAQARRLPSIGTRIARQKPAALSAAPESCLLDHPLLVDPRWPAPYSTAASPCPAPSGKTPSAHPASSRQTSSPLRHSSNSSPSRTKQKHPRSLTSLLLPLSFFTTDERHPLHGRRLSGDGDDDDDDGEENDPRPLAELLHQMTLDPGGVRHCGGKGSAHSDRPRTTSSVQLQPYRLPGSSSSSTAASSVTERTASTRSGRLPKPLLRPARPREARENSNFLRVVVLENNMRRVGKLSETTPGRAKGVLPPRRTSRASKSSSLSSLSGHPPECLDETKPWRTSHDGGRRGEVVHDSNRSDDGGAGVIDGVRTAPERVPARWKGETT